MTKKKKSIPMNEKTRKSINIEHFRKELNDLEAKGREFYSPKIGRQLKQLQKKIKRAS